MDLSRVSQLKLPALPADELDDSDVRAPHQKASAYVTLALNEAEYPHERGNLAMGFTDMGHQLQERDDPREYLELACQEVAAAAGATEVEWFEKDMEFARQTIESAK